MLACGDAHAAVQLQGAEWSRWTCGAQDLLWSGDARWWARHSPLLFPVVGRLREGLAWFDGRPHPMPSHGFASTTPFVLIERLTDQVTLALRSDARTHAAYPFAFELLAQYRLEPSAMAITLTLRNEGDTPLPYSIGLHPAFHWPWGAGGTDGHAVVFSHDEQPQVPVITPQGLFSAARRPLPLAGRRLPLTPALLADEALCLLDARSQQLAFEAPDGSAIEIEAQGFAHWALWSQPGAPLLSIEAWTGHGDPEDYRGEFAARPSTRHLAPDAVAQHGLRLRYRASGSLA